ncbi:DUF922 domain-containing protein [Acanthopleuribacter pedis]|uniref:SEL1-like repeat protein n=1 Tax=Acanthopleuribacter pedis TaxID=442870 RepID=A0A8J7QC79_9BACT|nr:DUF922 domain-containing protein [Acanthopleuribacter pedis]MBO1316865.1 SEL1-like repeat protein [Acanthopleuribacter pedis]
MQPPKKTQDDDKPNENPLIDMYIRTSWRARLAKTVGTLFGLAFFASLAAWYAWQVLEPQEREAWRKKSETLAHVDATLREHGLLPEHDPLEPPKTPAHQADSGKNTQASKNQGAVSGASEEEDVPLIDMSDPRIKKDLDPAVANSRKPEAKAAAAMAAKNDTSGLEPIRKLDKDGYSIVSSKDSTLREREEKVERLMREGGMPVRMKAWDSDRPLTWDDFSNENTLDQKRHSGAYILTTIHFEASRHGFKAFAVMYPNRSWVRSGYANPYTLAHEQLHFDISEIYARKLRAQLGAIAPDQSRRAFKLYSETLRELRAAQKAYDDATHHGRRREMQAKYASDSKEALAMLADHYWKPKWHKASPFAISHFYRGQTYELGIEGADQSWILARKAYKGAQGQDRGEAAVNLGRMYQFGLGVEQNARKAFQLYKSGARQGHLIAKFNLGIMYWRGIGTNPNEEKALELFAETAEVLPYARHALLQLEHGGPEPVQSVNKE